MNASESVDSEPLRIVYLDPFHGGSHAAVATGLARHSRHRLELLSLPARSWKWRMRGAAIRLAEALRDLPSGARPVDLIMTTDMLSVTDLRALLPGTLAGCRLVVYFHENQLTYPDRGGEPRDEHFACTNLTSALAADQVWFNSEFHRQAFNAAVPAFLARMPDYSPRLAAATIAGRSRVIAPGIEVAELPTGTAAAEAETAAPLILWNHRWEHDKDPETFFDSLEEVRRRGGRFRLAVAGQRFQQIPPVFATIGERFAAELVSSDQLETADYHRLLGAADIVVSTARHEFFGLAVLEAIAAGAYPLLPARLSYPEIIPATHHQAHLYQDEAELVTRLLDLLGRQPVPRATVLQQHVRTTFAWPRRAAAFDAALADCARDGAI